MPVVDRWVGLPQKVADSVLGGLGATNCCR